MSWISLKCELPKRDETVFWYDAMFDNIMLFALINPQLHDSDFSHFTRDIPSARPAEYNQYFGHKEVGWYP